MSKNGGSVSKISERSSHTEDDCEHKASGWADFGQINTSLGFVDSTLMREWELLYLSFVLP